MKKLRSLLFAGFTGCSNHSCVVTGPKSGMGTNGSCHCLTDMTRGAAHLLASRLHSLGEQSVLTPDEVDESALNDAGWALIDRLEQIQKDPMGCKPLLREIIQTYLESSAKNAS